MEHVDKPEKSENSQDKMVSDLSLTEDWKTMTLAEKAEKVSTLREELISQMLGSQKD